MYSNSPSQLHTADLCERRWAFRYIDGIKEPEGKKQADGDKLHKRAAAYLRAFTDVGDDWIGKLLRKATVPGMLPTPGPHLRVEMEEVFKVLDGYFMTAISDCLVPPQLEHPHCPVVVDHKSTSGAQYALNEDELRVDPQAIVYGLVAHRYFKDAVEQYGVVCRWIYYVATGTEERVPKQAFKVEVTLSWDEIQAGWARIVDRTRHMLELHQTAKTALDVAPTGAPQACALYGRMGCFYRDRCKLTTAQMIAGHMVQFQRATSAERKEEKMPTIAEMMGNIGKPAGVPTPTTPPPAAAAPAAPVGLPNNLTPEEAAWLESKRKDREARAAQAAAPVTPPPAPPPAPQPTAPVALPNLVADLQMKLGATGVNPPEQAPAGVGEKAKAKKSKGGDFILVLGGSVAKDGGFVVQSLIEILQPAMTAVATAAKAPHWGLAGPACYAMLATALDEYLTQNKPNGIVWVDTDSSESRAVREVLIHHADTVIRGG